MELALDGTASLFISAGLVVPGLKFVTGRSRPSADLGSSDFRPFTGGESFPSGHTTAAFAVAGSIATHYDRLWIKGLSYSVAGLVGYSRMVHDAHWLSDVTAGAFIGIGVAHEVTRLNLERRGIVLLPLHEQGTWGIRFARTF
jgi:membrane-associated phospholipid phosphatase